MTFHFAHNKVGALHPILLPFLHGGPLVEIGAEFFNISLEAGHKKLGNFSLGSVEVARGKRAGPGGGTKRLLFPLLRAAPPGRVWQGTPGLFTVNVDGITATPKPPPLPSHTRSDHSTAY